MKEALSLFGGRREINNHRLKKFAQKVVVIVVMGSKTHVVIINILRKYRKHKFILFYKKRGR